MVGDFNTAVMIETDVIVDLPAWLQERAANGMGLVIIGLDDKTSLTRGSGSSGQTPAGLRRTMPYSMS
jgi:hypothetical protein